MNVMPKHIREQMKRDFPGTCPTCGQPEGSACVSRTGRFLRSTSMIHATRKSPEDLKINLYHMAGTIQVFQGRARTPLTVKPHSRGILVESLVARDIIFPGVDFESDDAVREAVAPLLG